MRLLRHSDTDDITLTQFSDEAIPPYAILSHTWGSDTEEVTFDDLTSGKSKDKPGYEKIRFCGEQAALDDLKYFWIDTCCINKADKSELSQAIKSMFRWYRNAARCYVYLSDVPMTSIPLNEKNKLEEHMLSRSNWTNTIGVGNKKCNPSPWELNFRKSRWFTRGWTLQELLAPYSVSFYSKECKRLGCKSSLRKLICEITGIPELALQGGLLSQFSINERLSWIEHRQTKLTEDKAYSLQGIFGVYIAPIYGEGAATAFKRLICEIDRLEICVHHLRLTDARDDKKRIEETKGGLLEDPYRYILENSDFQQWRDGHQSRLLWIKGDPGKGKTMLLCGIIDELNKSIGYTEQLSYFFCQATDSRINNATAVLRGLLYLLVNQQPSLVSHIQKKYEHAGKALFEDANAWVALSDIFTKIVQDPSLNSTYLVIDALDECVVDLPKLLDFIAKQSSGTPRIKWIVSSRNWPDIEERLTRAGPLVRLSLELNAESVSTAVSVFIKQKLLQLAKEKKYDNKTKDLVERHLLSNADNTFLWVALVCQDLKKIPRWKVLAKLGAFAPGLDSLYERMLHQINSSDDADLCIRILASVVTVYRPVALQELPSLVELLDEVGDLESLQEITSLCGSFLTVRSGVVYFVHQSAKEFLIEKVPYDIFPSGRKEIHYTLFSRSLKAMSKTLRRDMYDLGALGYPAKRIERPDPDPLEASRYSCIYWVDHLCDWNATSSAQDEVDLQDGGAVDRFLRQKYLYWLEALSLCKAMSKGVVSMAKLKALIQRRGDATALNELVEDARRFVMSHKLAIEKSPLQAYASALLFSPTQSLVRGLFKEEEPNWITIKPAMDNTWSSCLLTLEGHSDWVSSVAFSHDSTQIVSASNDCTVIIWDACSGECLLTLEGHNDRVSSVAFSHDSTQIVSASNDCTVIIWDACSGECLLTFEGHGDLVTSVAFSHDSARIASASGDRTAKIWDACSGECLLTLEGHSDWVSSVAFSHNSARIATASADCTIKIWNTCSNECLLTLKKHSKTVNSVAFSHDSTQIVSASDDCTVRIWDACSGECLLTLKGHSDWVRSVAFSHDSTQVASASLDPTIIIWDACSGECLSTLKGHSDEVRSIAFSHDSAQVVSASDDCTVKIWNANSGKRYSTLQGHSSAVHSVAFSQDSTQFVTTSGDCTIKIWDMCSSECLLTLEGHSDWINLVAFSHDSTQIVSASDDCTVRIWDARSSECLLTFEGHSDWVRSVAFSHDSTQIASASLDPTIMIWDACSGECLLTLKGHSEGVRSIAFSHDSAQVVSASWDHTVKLWDACSGECLLTFEGHGDSVTSVAFSHDSARIASASGDRTAKIWDACSGECLLTLEGHSDWINLVAFSHDSTQIVSASDDCTVRIWDARSGECLSTLQVDQALCRVAFDVSGLYLHTDIGTIDISALSGSAGLSVTSKPCSPQYHGCALSAGVWISYNSEHLVWLPSEYRPTFSAVSKNNIIIGVGTGRVWMCNIERQDPKLS